MNADKIKKNEQDNDLNKTVKICICYHKPYNIIKNDVLFPVHAGKALTDLNLQIPGDNTGDNISEKNPFYCELTVTYWLWKNDASDIKGLFHYRRFLNLLTSYKKFYKISNKSVKQYGLTNKHINNIFKDYDVILPYPVNFEESIYDNYKFHCISDLDKALKIIQFKYPQMYEIAIKAVKNDSNMYIANILIAKKELFDEYAKWMFDILFELEKQIQHEVIKRDDYQKRAYGFLSERLTRIFFLYKETASFDGKGIKIAHAPLLTKEESLKKFISKDIKHEILMSIGIKKEKWGKKLCPK